MKTTGGLTDYIMTPIQDTDSNPTFGPIYQSDLSGSLRSDKKPHIHSELSVKWNILTLLWISLSSKTLLFSDDKIRLKWIIFVLFFCFTVTFKCRKHDINQCCSRPLSFNLLTPKRAKWLFSVSEIPWKTSNEWTTRAVIAPSFVPECLFI